MIVSYLLFMLDMSNMIFINAVFLTHVLKIEGPFIFIGITGSVHAFFSFIWKPIAGRLSDEKGSASILFWCSLGGLVGTVVCFLGGSLHILFIGRIITCLASPSQLLIRSIAADGDKNSQAESISMFGMIGAVAGIAAAIIFGLFLEKPDGIFYMYLVIMASSIISLGLIKLLPTTQPKQNSSRNTSSPVKLALEEITTALKNLKTYSSSEIYWDTFLLKALCTLSFTIIEAGYILILREVGIINVNVAYVFISMCVVSILSNVYLLKINKKYYTNDLGYQRIVHSSVVLIVTCILQGYFSQLWIFIPSFLIMTIAKVQADNTIMELLLQKTTEEKSIVLGCFDSIRSLTDLLSPVIGSLGMEYFGRMGVYTMSSFLVLLSSSVILCKPQSFQMDQNKKVK